MGTVSMRYWINCLKHLVCYSVHGYESSLTNFLISLILAAKSGQYGLKYESSPKIRARDAEAKSSSLMSRSAFNFELLGLKYPPEDQVYPRTVAVLQQMADFLKFIIAPASVSLCMAKAVLSIHSSTSFPTIITSS